MKVIRKIAAYLLALVMMVSLLPMTVFAASHTFTDVNDSNWFAEAVEYVYVKGLMQGYEDNTFKPENKLSRAEIVQILYNYEASPSVNTSNTGFDDVSSGAWYASAVVWATREGIVTGTSHTTFNPEAHITRQDMITVVWRYIANLYPQKYNAAGDFSLFADAGQVVSYASAAVNWAVGNGIINGVNMGGSMYLNPTGDTSRAEMATMLKGLVQTVLETGDLHVISLEVFGGGSATVNGRAYIEGTHNIKIVEDEDCVIDFAAESDGFISYFQVDEGHPIYLGYNYANISDYSYWDSYSYVLEKVDEDHNIQVYFIKDGQDERLVDPGGRRSALNENVNYGYETIDRDLIEAIYGTAAADIMFDYFGRSGWVVGNTIRLGGMCAAVTISSILISQPWLSGIAAADFSENESYTIPMEIAGDDIETATGKDLSLRDIARLWQASWPLYSNQKVNLITFRETDHTRIVESSEAWTSFFDRIEHYMKTHTEPLYIYESGIAGVSAGAHAMMVVGVEGHEDFGRNITIHVVDPNRGKARITLQNSGTTSYEINEMFGSPNYSTSKSLYYFQCTDLVAFWNDKIQFDPENTYENSSLLMVSTDSGSVDGIAVTATDGSELALVEPPSDPGEDSSYVKMFMVPNDTSYIITNTTDDAIYAALGNDCAVIDAKIESGVSAIITISDSALDCDITLESATEASCNVTMRFNDSAIQGASGVSVSGSFDGTASMRKTNGSVLANGFDAIETKNEYVDGSSISNSYTSLSGQTAEINDISGIITVSGVGYSDNLSSTAAKAALEVPAGASFVNGIATWDAVSGAEYYEVGLLKDGNRIGLQVCTSDCYYDLSSYMRVAGARYSFEVSATGTGYLDSAFAGSNTISKASSLADPQNTTLYQGIGNWAAVDGAIGYELALYNYDSGKIISDNIIVDNTSYNFSPIMDNGVYYFTVKALGNGSDNIDSAQAVSNNYSNYIMSANEYTIEMDAITTAPDENLGGGLASTEYEGKQVVLQATVTDEGGRNVTGGHVYFFKNGKLLSFAPVAVVDGKAEYSADISSYIGDATDKLNNYDTFTASYVGSGSYGETAVGSKVYIRSAVIATPIISANGATTASGVINNLPVATPIAFELNDAVVKATDGRELVLGSDYSFAWQKTGLAGFTDIPGASTSTFTASGSTGDSWRLRLVAIGNMASDGISLQANVGQKSDPDINLIITDTFAPRTPSATNNFHAGDEATLAVEIVGDASGDTPTGWVTFYAGSVAIKTVQLSTGFNGTKFFAEASVATILNSVGTLDISVKYYGDNNYNAGEAIEKSNKDRCRLN